MPNTPTSNDSSSEETPPNKIKLTLKRPAESEPSTEDLVESPIEPSRSETNIPKEKKLSISRKIENQRPGFKKSEPKAEDNPSRKPPSLASDPEPSLDTNPEQPENNSPSSSPKLNKVPEQPFQKTDATSSDAIAENQKKQMRFSAIPPDSNDAQPPTEENRDNESKLSKESIDQTNEALPPIEGSPDSLSSPPIEISPNSPPPVPKPKAEENKTIQSSASKQKLGLMNRPPISKYENNPLKEPLEKSKNLTTPLPKVPPPSATKKSKKEKKPANRRFILTSLLFTFVVISSYFFYGLYFQESSTTQNKPTPTPILSPTKSIEDREISPYQTTQLDDSPTESDQSFLESEPKAVEQHVAEFLDNLKIQLVKSSGEKTGVFIGNIFYNIGDVLSPEAQLRLLSIDSDTKKIQLIDSSNNRYFVAY